MGHSQRTGTLVIGLAGHKGSGKTTIAAALASQLNATIASFGDYVRKYAAGAVDAVKLADLGANLLATQGPHHFVDKTINASGWDEHAPLIIEGIRHIAILDALRERFPDLQLIYITTPHEQREQRLHERDHLDVTAIKRLETHSTETEVPLLQSRATYTVDGSTDAEHAAQMIAERVRQ